MQREKEDALRKQYDLQKELDSKQKLELEIEQLRGKLEVMKHMGDEEGTKLKELDKLCEKLKEKDEEMEDMESLNQTLIIKERRTNDELAEAKDELISVCIMSLLTLLWFVINNILNNPFLETNYSLCRA